MRWLELVARLSVSSDPIRFGSRPLVNEENRRLQHLIEAPANFVLVPMIPNYFGTRLVGNAMIVQACCMLAPASDARLW